MSFKIFILISPVVLLVFGVAVRATHFSLFQKATRGMDHYSKNYFRQHRCHVIPLNTTKVINGFARWRHALFRCQVGDIWTVVCDFTCVDPVLDRPLGHEFVGKPVFRFVEVDTSTDGNKTTVEVPHACQCVSHEGSVC